MIKITTYSLSDIDNNPNKFNVNNLWSHEPPADYSASLNSTLAKHWLYKFHSADNIKTLTLDKADVSCLKQAFKIGCITRQFPKSFIDELEQIVDKYAHIPIDKPYFVRTDRVSLKYGCHGLVPFDNLQAILEAIVTTTHGHSCFESDDTNTPLTIYFLPWLNNIDVECRVFVYMNTVTAISDQHIYAVNHTLAKLSTDELTDLFTNMINYIQQNVIPQIDFMSSYTIDIAHLTNNQFYFIEINPFGAEYAAGSALFHWLTDHDQLYGLTDYVEVRYVSTP